MIFRRALLIGLALAASVPSAPPAWAQGDLMETGTLRPVRPAGGWGTGKAEGRNIVRKFAACSIGRGRGLAEKFLHAPVGGEDWQRLQRNVLRDECLGAGQLQIPFDIIRGALFEQLYLLDFARHPQPDLSAAAPIDYTAGYGPGPKPNAVALARLGDCVARADAEGVRALMGTIPDAPAEKSAFDRLRPKLPACVPQGLQVAFSRSILRAALAEGLYRVSRAAVGRPWEAA